MVLSLPHISVDSKASRLTCLTTFLELLRVAHNHESKLIVAAYRCLLSSAT